MKKFNFNFGDIAILLAAGLWGCISIFTRSMFDLGFTPVQTVAVRAFITALVMLIIILIKNPRLLKVSPRDLWLFIGSGICSFLFFNICYMSSIGENSVSVACILMYTSPIWVSLLSAPIFKERMTTKKTICLIICFSGSALLCLSGSLKITPIGLVCGLLSGFGYALYSIFGKLASKKYNTLTITFYTFLFGSIGALTICDIGRLARLASSPQNIALSLLIAVFCTILPYLLYTYGLSKTPAGKAAVLSIFEPIIASVVGMTVFAEIPGLFGFVGIAVTVTGIILLEKWTENQKTR